MRKYLISLAAAASALAVAAPVSAQYYGGSQYGYNRYGYSNYGANYQSQQLISANRERMARMHNDIQVGVARGMISPGEAARLHQRAAQFDRELAQLARGGMTGEEGAIFDARADRLAQEIQARTGYGRGYRYGNNYGFGNGYGYDNGYDAYGRR